MTWPALRALSRNPLIRASDRIESFVVVLAAVAVLVATACAGVLGTMVYGARTQMYAEQLQTRHVVVAIATEDSKISTLSQAVVTTVYARWQINGTADAAELIWDKPVKAGDPLQIWVDNDGNRVGPPSPVSRAATDAVTAAIVAWLSAILTVAAVVSAVRTRTRRMREAQWDRDIRCLVDDNGGHTNRTQ
ncbi:Rv1733c family protein [Mycobacterium sp.]|uniref:Rv1733c family protein n=1 Tax=Mycobacterium sp. TaxID=1785 RepID=UPI003D6A07F8